MTKQITALISATTNYRTLEYNTTEDATTDYDYDYSTTEETMTQNDTAIENDKPKSRFFNTRTGNPKNTLYGQNKLA